MSVPSIWTPKRWMRVTETYNSPIFLRKAARTKAYVFIALLALKLTRLFDS